MDKKVFMVDFDNTILPFSDESCELVFQALLGKEYCKKLYELHDGKRSFIDIFIEKYSGSIKLNEINGMWDNFLKTDLYEDIKKNIEENKINDIFKSIEKIKDGKNILEFYIREIIFPLVGLVDVYVGKLEPYKEFINFLKKAENSKSIVIINTLKAQEMIENELLLFAKLNNEYKIFNNLLENDRVFGTTKDNCKFDENRIEFILEKINSKEQEKFEKVIIVGDSSTDVNNFINCKLSKKSIYFVDKTKNLENIKDFFKGYGVDRIKSDFEKNHQKCLDKLRQEDYESVSFVKPYSEIGQEPSDKQLSNKIKIKTANEIFDLFFNQLENCSELKLEDKSELKVRDKQYRTKDKSFDKEIELKKTI